MLITFINALFQVWSVWGVKGLVLKRNNQKSSNIFSSKSRER